MRALATLGLSLVSLALAAEAGGCTPKEGCEVTAHCFEGTHCVEGTCQDVDTSRSCRPEPGASDGCDAWHVCANVSGDTETLELRCVEAAACGDCASPFGEHPGACNNGVWDEKTDGICLPGRCQSTSDCAPGDACVYPAGESLGFCSSGSRGSLCVVGTDCFFDVCSRDPSEPLGVCLGPTAGGGDGDGDGNGDGDGDSTDCVANGGFCYAGFCDDVGATQRAYFCDTFGDSCCF